MKTYKYIAAGLLIFLLSSQWCSAYPLNVAIVVNKNNPVDEISVRDLSKIFKLEKSFWPDSSKIYMIMRESGSIEREVVLKQVFEMSNEELKKYWVQNIYREKMTVFPKALHSDASVKQFVTKVPNAIGYINAANVDSSVKVLKVNGKLPTDSGYPISD